LTLDQQPPAFDVNQCEQGIEHCTDSEKDALDQYSQCLSQIGDCEPGIEEATQIALSACSIPMRAQIGKICRQSLKNLP
jgi:hypothetical protein